MEDIEAAEKKSNITLLRKRDTSELQGLLAGEDKLHCHLRNILVWMDTPQFENKYASCTKSLTMSANTDFKFLVILQYQILFHRPFFLTEPFRK